MKVAFSIASRRSLLGPARQKNASIPPCFSLHFGGGSAGRGEKSGAATTVPEKKMAGISPCFSLDFWGGSAGRVEKSGFTVRRFYEEWVSRCEPDFSTLPADPPQKSSEKQGEMPAIFFSGTVVAAPDFSPLPADPPPK
jgi:hypothetical protein